MFAAYTGKSWVQPPVGPPFFISLYDLKNDFLSSVVIFSENITGGADELYLQGNDSCDAEVSSATPSTYMVGPMFLVSLHHMFLLLYAARLHGDLLYKTGYVGQGGQETLILDDPPSSRIF